MMNTNDLIQNLSRDLAPVRPLRRPGVRAVAWIAGAAVYVAALTALLAKTGSPIDLAEPRVWLPHLAAIAACLLASWAAFASVIPGHSRRPAAWAVIGVLVWIAAVVIASRWDADLETVVGAGHEAACVVMIIGGGAPLLVVMAVLLRRGAPFTPGATAAFAALAVGALTNIGACFWRPHAVDDVVLFWHGGAILALVLACTIGARIFPTVIGARLNRSR